MKQIIEEKETLMSGASLGGDEGSTASVSRGALMLKPTARSNSVVACCFLRLVFS